MLLAGAVGMGLFVRGCGWDGAVYPRLRPGRTALHGHPPQKFVLFGNFVTRLSSLLGRKWLKAPFFGGSRMPPSPQPP